MGENELSKEEAKLVVEHDRDMMIFWAVLVFTCVTGIVGLLSKIEPPFDDQQLCLLIIYLALLAVMSFGIRRTFEIQREIREIAKSEILGTGIMNKAIKKPTFFDKVIDLEWRKHEVGKYIEVLFIVPIWVVFGALYVAIIHGWQFLIILLLLTFLRIAPPLLVLAVRRSNLL
jgi:hypothetical protein